MPHPWIGKCGHIERSADRRRRDSTREMHEIADETPRPRERQMTASWFVHPCTSRELRSAQCYRPRPVSIVAGHLLDASSSTRASGPKTTRNRVGGEGEAFKNEARTGSNALPQWSRRPGRKASWLDMTGPGMDFPDCVTYAIIDDALHGKGIPVFQGTDDHHAMVPTGQARVFVHLLPRLIPPGSLRGGIAVVVDVLRATTVMVQALASGCEAIIPCAEIEEAKAGRGRLAGWFGLARRRAAGFADPGIRPGQLARRVHSRRFAGRRRWS